MPIVVNGTTLTALEDGDVGGFSLSFPSGTVTATKLSQMNSSGSTIYYYKGELTKTYNYSYDTISVNGTTLTSSYKLVAGSNTGIRYNAYYAKYTGGILTLRSYRYEETTASGSTTKQLTIPTTTVRFDYTSTKSSIDTVYARVGDTGSWVLVFGQGGTVTVALWFGGNWKMNKVKSEIDTFFDTFNSALELDTNKKVVIFPPICYLDYVKSKITASGLSSMVSLGAQNISAYEKGAYTGQISAQQVADCGCTYAMVGEYEVRGYLGATDADVNNAVGLAFSNGLKVILCVGEDLTERDGGTYATYVKNQLQTDLAGIASSSVENGGLTIVYEPVWGIGTGKTITVEQVNDMITNIIRPKIIELYGTEIGNNVDIAMGGSVNAKTIQPYITNGRANGGLVSGASLKGDVFASIINTTTA